MHAKVFYGQSGCRLARWITYSVILYYLTCIAWVLCINSFYYHATNALGLIEPAHRCGEAAEDYRNNACIVIICRVNVLPAQRRHAACFSLNEAACFACQIRSPKHDLGQLSLFSHLDIGAIFGVERSCCDWDVALIHICHVCVVVDCTFSFVFCDEVLCSAPVTNVNFTDFIWLFC